MKTAPTLLLLGLATTTWPAFAQHIDLSKLPPASTKPGVTYTQDIRPLFEASCFRCHGAERPHGDLRLDSRDAVLAGGEHGQVIVPGKGNESRLLLAVAQLDDETAMPPKHRQGPGGPGGPGQMMARQMLSQADRNGDQKLSRAEFTAVADLWFEKLDPEQTGKLSQDQFTARFGALLPARSGPGGGGPPDGGPSGGGPRPGGGGGPGRFIGQAFFTAADADKDGSVTRLELRNTFTKWFGDWDADKSGALDEAKLRAGLNAALPRPPSGGPGGQGGQGGPGGPGGPGRPEDSGAPATPLTAEQVGLVRAWIDQGAK